MMLGRLLNQAYTRLNWANSSRIISTPKIIPLRNHKLTLSTLSTQQLLFYQYRKQPQPETIIKKSGNNYRNFASFVAANTTTTNIDTSNTLNITDTTKKNFNMASNFSIVRAIKTDYGIDITKFRSNKTGLSVIHVDVEGPLVNGYFALATEALDDDGCPHTLEHLVFLGSEIYPYKGVLDSLANRALAQGTNAWTDVDHTCYTITTAGCEGFLDLLPIYVDHILYPTLTDSGYVTEVHHINGKGENAGVVYSEMQGRQNTGDSRIYLQAQRLMYPEGIGYRSETGGLMECIRKLNVDKIRNYHRDYYRPDNLCLVITGKVPHDKLLATLGPLDERIASKGPLSSYKRPWVESSPVPPITKSIEQVVEFPDEDESIGQIMISWQGPKVNEHLDLMALEILHKYLSDSAISVLQKEFVEIEEPLCTSISFNISQHIRAPILVEFSNVPTEELNELSSRIFPVLERVAKEGFDMNRMKTVIYRDKLKTLNYVETNPQSGFAIACITDFIYGKKNGEELEKAFKDLEYYDEVAKFTNEQWVGYLRKYYLDNPHITLLGKPSAAFAKSLAEDEKKRVETQIEELGSDKLKELDNLLEEAKNKNEVPVPPEIIEGFPIPQVEHIPLISVVTGRNQPILLFDNPVQDYLNQDSKVEPPYFIQYDHIRSSFVSISILISTTAVPAELRPYLEIFLDSFYSLPLNRPDGTKLTYEEVIKELNEDTVHYNYGLGASGAFEDLISFNIKVEASKYAKAIQWLRDLLWYTEFTSERLKIIASKLLNDIPANKRDGNKMASAVLRTVLFDPVKSNQYALNILCQERFLPEALKRLEETPEKVVEDLLRFRNILTRPENFRIHVVGDILKLKDPKGAWVENFLNIEPENPLVPVRLAQEVLTEFGKNPGHKGYIVSLPAIESTFSIHCAKGITAFDSPDLAPLLVLCELLQTMEGVFWRMIRGQGLAYSVWLQASVEAGLVYFAIYRSPDAFKAFDQARKVISDLSQKTAEFDLPSLEGAKSGVIYSIISSEKTMAMAATKSFISIVLKNLPPNHSHEMIKQVQAVTVDDLHRMLNKYLTNLFLAETSNVVVASAPGKVKDVQGGFAKHGFHLENKGLDNIIKLE